MGYCYRKNKQNKEDKTMGLEQLVPRYGNYGGPGHSGERRNPDGTLALDRNENTIPFWEPAIDALDECFKLHDHLYHDADQRGGRAIDYLNADIVLLHDLLNLSPNGLSPEAQEYRIKAIVAFTEKLIFYDAQRTAIEEILKLFPDAREEISPIILDLDGDGVETTNVKDGAYFDHDGNGFAEQTGWAASDDGLLVMDRNNDGIINDGRELFGSETILSNGQRASNGFEALAELDDNHDGKIDASDAAFARKNRTVPFFTFFTLFALLSVQPCVYGKN
jgi:hypothetical protein